MKFLRLAFLFIILIKTTFSQNTFHHIYTGNNKRVYGNDISATRNNNYVITGYIQDSLDKLVAINIDEFGNENWLKVFVDSNDVRGEKIIQSYDNSFIVIAKSSDDLSIIRLDSLGSFMAKKSIHLTDYFLYNPKIILAYDSGLVISAIANKNVLNQKAIIKLDKFDNLEWAKLFLNTSNTGGDIISDNVGYTIVSSSYGRIALSRLDLGGTIQWTRYTELTTFSLINGISRTSDAGYIMVGSKDTSSCTGQIDGLIIRTDSAGIIKWINEYYDYCGDTRMYNAFEEQNGNYIVSSEVLPFFDYECAIISIDSLGNINWYKNYANNSARPFKVVNTSDGGFLTSTTGLNHDLGFDLLSIYVIKTDSIGETSCLDSTATFQIISPNFVNDTMTIIDSLISISINNSILTEVSALNKHVLCSQSTEVNNLAEGFDFEIFPNPASSYVQVVLKSAKNSVHYEIINYSGTRIKEGSHTGESNFKIDLSGLYTGLYLLRVEFNNRIVIKKIIIL